MLYDFKTVGPNVASAVDQDGDPIGAYEIFSLSGGAFFPISRQKETIGTPDPAGT